MNDKNLNRLVPASLYHGTSVYNLASIIDENALREGVHWGKPGEPHGPRTTGRYSIAEKFIDYSATEYQLGGVIELASDDLFYDYDIVPYQDTFYTGEPMSDEDEFVILTPAIKRLDRSLLQIYCNAKDIEEAMRRDTIECAREMGGYPFNMDRELLLDAEYRLVVELLDRLLDHPYRMERPAFMEDDDYYGFKMSA